MSVGRLTMRGLVFQGRVFAPFVLASGSGAVPVAYETQRHTLYGTSLERHTLTATTAQRATLYATSAEQQTLGELTP